MPWPSAFRRSRARLSSGVTRAIRLAARRSAPGTVRSWLAGPGGTRLLAAGGIAGPVLFTAAWAVSSLRQAGYSATAVQLSGLAAEDARDPQIMMAGFAGLGACSVALGAALGRVAGPRSAGPWLVACAGLAAVAAGMFRRDHMLLAGPGFAGESWHNQVHDVAADAAYAAMIAAPLALAWRLRGEPGWAAMSRVLPVLAILSAAGLVLFASRAAEPWDATVQRVAVTSALVAETLIAARILARRQPRYPGPGRRRPD